MFIQPLILVLLLNCGLALAQNAEERVGVRYSVKVKEGGLTLISANGKIRVRVEEGTVLSVRDYGTHKYEIVGSNRSSQSVVFYVPKNLTDILETDRNYSVRPSRPVITAYSRPNQSNSEVEDCPIDSGARGYRVKVPDELCKVGWPNDEDQTGMFAKDTDIVETPNGWKVWTQIAYRYERPIGRNGKRRVVNEGNGWVPIEDLRYDGRPLVGNSSTINVNTTEKPEVNTDDPNLKSNPDPTQTEGTTVIDCKDCQPSSNTGSVLTLLDDEKIFEAVFEHIGEPINSCKSDSSLGTNASIVQYNEKGKRKRRVVFQDNENKMFFTKHYRNEHWYRQGRLRNLPNLRDVNGITHPSIDIVAVDACARTCYGEMGLAECGGTGSGASFTVSDPPAYIMATVKSMHCRAEESRAAKAAGHRANQRNRFLNSKDQFLSNDLIAVAGSPCQYSVWNNFKGCFGGEQNAPQEKILCPPKQDSAEQAINSAHRSRINNVEEKEIFKACARQCYNLVFNKEQFLEETKDFNNCDYTSGTNREYHNGNRRLKGRDIPRIAGVSLSNGRCMELYDEN